jgi:hypothetical protein
MAQKDPQTPRYWKWLSRSILMVGLGVVMLICSLLIPPTQEFGPGLPSRLDDEERIALLGLIAVSVGIATALICGMVWLKTGLWRAVRKYRK